MIERAILESDLGLTPNNDGSDHPPAGPRAHRGAPQASSSRSSATWPRKAAWRSATSAATCMHDLRELRDEGEAGADEEHRAEGALQKLTDEKVKELEAILKGKEEEILEGERRPVRRHHHGWQRTLGPAAGGCPSRRATGPGRHRQGPAARAVDLGIARADRLLVLDRELVAPAGGGRRPDGAVQRAHPRRDARAARPGRADALRRPPRGRAARADRADGVGGGARPPTTTASRCSSPSTTAGARRSSTRPSGTPAAARKTFRALLYAPEMHDPDLMIRTSGEQRISNYLLWQAAYSELHFTDVLWPDFSRADFEEALASTRARVRRFGGDEACAPRRRGVRARAAQSRAGSDWSRGSWSRSPRSSSRSRSSGRAAGCSRSALSGSGCVRARALGMFERARPITLAGFIALAGLAVAGPRRATSARCCSRSSASVPLVFLLGRRDAAREPAPRRSR